MKSNIITIDADEIVVRISQDHEFLLETKEVALGYGVSETVIRRHKQEHADELVDGKHFVSCVQNMNAGGPPIKRTLWTKRGVIRLGFFIRSERAKRFRDAAEDLVLREVSAPAVTDYRADFAALHATLASLADSVAKLATVVAAQAERTEQPAAPAATPPAADSRRSTAEQIAVAWLPTIEATLFADANARWWAGTAEELSRRLAPRKVPVGLLAGLARAEPERCIDIRSFLRGSARAFVLSRQGFPPPSLEELAVWRESYLSKAS